MPTKMYVIPPVQVEDPATEEMIWQPKYLDRDDVSGFDGTLTTPPAGYSGPTNPDGEVYVARIHAEQQGQAAIAQDQEVMLVQQGGDVEPNSIGTPPERPSQAEGN